jgi:hypothetical protein
VIKDRRGRYWQEVRVVWARKPYEDEIIERREGEEKVGDEKEEREGDKMESDS